MIKNLNYIKNQLVKKDLLVQTFEEFRVPESINNDDDEEFKFNGPQKVNSSNSDDESQS